MILADHCVFGTTVRLLRDAGFAVHCLRDFAPPDSADAEVLRLAVERSFVLLTNDLDFSNVVRYPPREHTGAIVLRIDVATEEAVHVALLRLLQDHPPEHLRGVLAVVSARKFRLRR